MVPCRAGDGKTFEEIVAVRVRFICAQRLVQIDLSDAFDAEYARTRRIMRRLRYIRDVS